MGERDHGEKEKAKKSHSDQFYSNQESYVAGRRTVEAEQALIVSHLCFKHFKGSVILPPPRHRSKDTLLSNKRSRKNLRATPSNGPPQGGDGSGLMCIMGCRGKGEIYAATEFPLDGSSVDTLPLVWISGPLICCINRTFISLRAPGSSSGGGSGSGGSSPSTATSTLSGNLRPALKHEPRSPWQQNSRSYPNMGKVEVMLHVARALTSRAVHSVRACVRSPSTTAAAVESPTRSELIINSLFALRPTPF